MTQQVIRCQDEESGLRGVIAIDDTTLGPGLGGVRWLAYPSEQAAEDEARRLAHAMTLKNACADLPYGGAKSVLLRDDRRGADDAAGRRRAQLRAFGRCVQRLGGTYIPGAVIGCVADEVSCQQLDPSPSTALGVFAGIEAALIGTGRRVAGARVVVQGVGHVGADLARRLAAGGADVTVADVDADRASSVAGEIGGRAVQPGAALTAACDVLAPCATAKVVDAATVGSLRCSILAGGANDVLATADMATALAARGVLYIPDFVINAGSSASTRCVPTGVRTSSRSHCSPSATGWRASRRRPTAPGEHPWRSPRRWRHTGWVGPSARWAD